MTKIGCMVSRTAGHEEGKNCGQVSLFFLFWWRLFLGTYGPKTLFNIFFSEWQIKLAVAYLAGKALLGWLQMHSREIACCSTIRGMEDACHAPMESGQHLWNWEIGATAVLHFFPGWAERFETHRFRYLYQLLPHHLRWHFHKWSLQNWEAVTEGALANGMRRCALCLGIGGFPICA